MNDKIVFLMYHNITGRGDIYSVSKKNFTEQMDFLAEQNFHTLTLSDFLELEQKKVKSNDKFIVITFDDGYVDNYTTVLPILQERALKATFFITTGYIDSKKNMLNSEQIKHLSDAKMCIGSHARSHTFLTKLKLPELFAELEESKINLEKITKKKISHLSLPGGRYNNKVLKTAQQIGYHTVCNSEINPNGFHTNQFKLGRIAIKKNMSLDDFSKIIKQDKGFIKKLQIFSFWKKIAKASLGNVLYYKLWNLWNH